VSSVVKGSRRKRNGSVSNRETGIPPNGREMAALSPSDPLRYTLELSLDELRSLRRALGPVFERRPAVRRAFEDIIGHKERERDRHRVREGRQTNG
jgi:hypothetical protein